MRTRHHPLHSSSCQSRAGIGLATISKSMYRPSYLWNLSSLSCIDEQLPVRCSTSVISKVWKLSISILDHWTCQYLDICPIFVKLHGGYIRDLIIVLLAGKQMNTCFGGTRKSGSQIEASPPFSTFPDTVMYLSLIHISEPTRPY